ncbi:hypothetical protein VTO42DRAFT_1439 [Malbranchea cinnamomea]
MSRAIRQKLPDVGKHNKSGQQLFRPPGFLKDLYPSGLSPEPGQHEDNRDARDRVVIDLTSPRGSQSSVASPGSCGPTINIISLAQQSQRNYDLLSVNKTPSTDTSYQSKESSEPPVFSNQSQVTVEEAEVWLQFRLMEEEKKKSRTRIIPSLSPSSSAFQSFMGERTDVREVAPSSPILRPLQRLPNGHERDERMQTWATGLGGLYRKRAENKALKLSHHG